MQEVSARVWTVHVLALISLLLWSYVCWRSIDYFLPADERKRARQSVRLRRAVLTAVLMSLATLLLLLPG
ncbi:hypothetical protein [Pantoea sp. App145]|uniref:hypothetical protein n=1 Tax=Pantoea sp. App145 TaxID=3071567 RepID=UPI003A7F7DD0